MPYCRARRSSANNGGDVKKVSRVEAGAYTMYTFIVVNWCTVGCVIFFFLFKTSMRSNQSHKHCILLRLVEGE